MKRCTPFCGPMAPLSPPQRAGRTCPYPPHHIHGHPASPFLPLGIHPLTVQGCRGSQTSWPRSSRTPRAPATSSSSSSSRPAPAPAPAPRPARWVACSLSPDPLCARALNVVGQHRASSLHPAGSGCRAPRASEEVPGQARGAARQEVGLVGGTARRVRGCSWNEAKGGNASYLPPPKDAVPAADAATRDHPDARLPPAQFRLRDHGPRCFRQDDGSLAPLRPAPSPYTVVGHRGTGGGVLVGAPVHLGPGRPLAPLPLQASRRKWHVLVQHCRRAGGDAEVERTGVWWSRWRWGGAGTLIAHACSTRSVAPFPSSLTSRAVLSLRHWRAARLPHQRAGSGRCGVAGPRAVHSASQVVAAQWGQYQPFDAEGCAPLSPIIVQA